MPVTAAQWGEATGDGAVTAGELQLVNLLLEHHPALEAGQEIESLVELFARGGYALLHEMRGGAEIAQRLRERMANLEAEREEAVSQLTAAIAAAEAELQTLKAGYRRRGGRPR